MVLVCMSDSGRVITKKIKIFFEIMLLCDFRAGNYQNANKISTQKNSAGTHKFLISLIVR
jgi:hypothetical protein